jgi:hypothetical protein
MESMDDANDDDPGNKKNPVNFGSNELNIPRRPLMAFS